MTWGPDLTENVDALAEAIRSGVGLRCYTSVQSKPDPPAVILGPPKLEFDGNCAPPTNAKLVAFLVVAENDKSIATLLELLPKVCDAIYGLGDFVVLDASPSLYPGKLGTLPAYAITTEFGL